MFRLITNNEALCASVMRSEYVEGSSLDVLLRVRGLVHSGSIIITHPLCGNLRPNHQPYRSVIIDELKGPADFDSLSLIEQAISVYQSCRLILPCELDELRRADYAYVDAEIMRESISQCGLMRGGCENLCAATLLPSKEVISHAIGTPKAER
ncbi:MAG: GrdX family protein [Synergistaceae bacterium]|nr:GrdX family protein [Synergistaceae bacterium]